MMGALRGAQPSGDDPGRGAAGVSPRHDARARDVERNGLGRNGGRAVTAYLRGREEVIWALGWRSRHPEWIALVALTGGYFTKGQLSAFLEVEDRQGKKIIRRMLERKIVTKQLLDRRSVCRIPAVAIYRALGVPHLCPRAAASEGSIVRRLLALDYVLEHLGLPWLAVEAEKVRAFEALGIGRELLPGRLCGGRAWHLCPDGFPIALDATRACFAFVDPGYTGTAALRKWGKAHRPLWEALWTQGRAVEVVAVVRTVRELQRARRTLELWSGRDASGSEEGRVVRRELGRVERAIRTGDQDALAPYGNLQGGLRRIVELRKLERSTRPLPAIDAFDTWRSVRLQGAWS